MTQNKAIGLIGGVGPWAGLDVHRKILSSSRRKNEQEYPSVIHLSFPEKFSDRSDYLLGKTEVNPAYAFSEALLSLEQLGAGSAAIICNTAHAGPIINVIQAQLTDSSLSYINIVEETQKRLEADQVGCIGLLATLGTYRFNIYQEYFSGKILYPSRKYQQQVHDCVYHPGYGIKIHHTKYQRLLCDKLSEATQELIAKGADALVLGCTELPLLSGFRSQTGIPVYDPNQILAEALIKQTGSTVNVREFT